MTVFSRRHAAALFATAAPPARERDTLAFGIATFHPSEIAYFPLI